MRRRYAIAAGLLMSPQWALACAVCGAGPEESRDAFMYSTIILTALPLMLLFGGLYWLRSAYMGPPGRR